MIPSLIQLDESYSEFFEKKTGEKIVIITSPEQAKEILPGAKVLISFPFLPLEYLEIAKDLEWLYVMSAGVDGLPFEELSRRGITVTNSSGIHIKQMSEHALGIMIMFSRGLGDHLKAQVEKKWERRLNVDELEGKTLCVVGAGRVGAEIARKAKAFDMKVIGIKASPRPMEYFDEIYGLESLEDCLKVSDYVVLLTPLTDKTYHLFGEKQFDAMKESAVFINMSRGDTVDEEAVIRALEQKKIRGAGLDVFHNEPLEPDSRLWELDNVMITPHNSGLSRHYFEKAADLFAESYQRYQKGLTLPNRVDLIKQY